MFQALGIELYIRALSHANLSTCNEAAAGLCRSARPVPAATSLHARCLQLAATSDGFLIQAQSGMEGFLTVRDLQNQPRNAEVFELATYPVKGKLDFRSLMGGLTSQAPI